MPETCRLAMIDKLDSLRLRINGAYEGFEMALVRRTLKPGQAFVDIGAHIGYYSFNAAEIVGKSGAVYAFEPDPENLVCLRKNVECFGEIVRVYPWAVSDRDGDAKLYRSLENSGDHQLYASAEDRESIQVEVVSLDAALPFQIIDFIKIDVQGSECQVLRGARELLARSRDIVGIIEFSAKHLAMAGDSAAEFLSLLDRMGFKRFIRIGRQIAPATTEILLGLSQHVNLFISRRELK